MQVSQYHVAQTHVAQPGKDAGVPQQGELQPMF